jgi:TonB family protein
MKTRAKDSAVTLTTRAPWRFGHLLLALGVTLLLLALPVINRWLRSIESGDQVILPVEAVPTVALSKPPPSSVQAQRLDSDSGLEIKEVAPSSRTRPSSAKASGARVSTSPSRAMTPSVPNTTSLQAPVKRSSYDASDLDATPGLVNRPLTAYPREQLRAGLKEGRVVLEVSIGTSGRITMRRVISSPHADFTAMARKFASQARFSVPKKKRSSGDGDLSLAFGFATVRKLARAVE